MRRREWMLGAGAGAAALTLARPGAAKPTMSTRKIPSTGEALPVIGMGTWSTFDVGRGDYDSRREVLQAFFAAGGRVLDSSPMYGRAEKVVGDLLPDVPQRADAFVATKVWTRGGKQGIREMEDSIRKMGGKVDLMQIHNLVDWRTHLPTLRAWKAEGKIRYLGVTHYQISAFDELEKIMATEAMDFVQLPYSIGVREAEKRLLPCAETTGTAVLVMRPFEGGSLFSAVKGRALPELAKDLGIESWGQYFLEFILGHPAVTCPIPATSKLEHMRDNLGAGHGPMPDANLRAKMIAALGL